MHDRPDRRSVDTRAEEGIAALCRREGRAPNLYYRWSKEFLEAGKKRLLGDTTREATSTEVQDLRRENSNLKQVVAETVLGSAAELLGIIRAQHPREATDKRKAVECPGHRSSPEGASGDDGNRFGRGIIDNRQTLDHASIGRSGERLSGSHDMAHPHARPRHCQVEVDRPHLMPNMPGS